MTHLAMEDNGRMAAVLAPIQEIERMLKTVDGYVVIANINSNRQAVIGGASKPVEQAMEAFQKAGYDVAAIPVSHAFHTSIVAGASSPCAKFCDGCIFNRHVCQSSPTLTASFIPWGLTSSRRCWTFSRSRSLHRCNS